MGGGEWVLTGLVILAFVFVILRPDLWGRRSRRHSSDGGSTAVGVDGSGRRRDDDDDDGDADADSGDGGGDGGD